MLYIPENEILHTYEINFIIVRKRKIILIKKKTKIAFANFKQEIFTI